MRQDVGRADPDDSHVAQALVRFGTVWIVKALVSEMWLVAHFCGREMVA